MSTKDKYLTLFAVFSAEIVSLMINVLFFSFFSNMFYEKMIYISIALVLESNKIVTLLQKRYIVYAFYAILAIIAGFGVSLVLIQGTDTTTLQTHIENIKLLEAEKKDLSTIEENKEYRRKYEFARNTLNFGWHGLSREEYDAVRLDRDNYKTLMNEEIDKVKKAKEKITQIDKEIENIIVSNGATSLSDLEKRYQDFLNENKGNSLFLVLANYFNLDEKNIRFVMLLSISVLIELSILLSSIGYNKQVDVDEKEVVKKVEPLKRNKSIKKKSKSKGIALKEFNSVYKITKTKPVIAEPLIEETSVKNNIEEMSYSQENNIEEMTSYLPEDEKNTNIPSDVSIPLTIETVITLIKKPIDYHTFLNLAQDNGLNLGLVNKILNFASKGGIERFPVLSLKDNIITLLREENESEKLLIENFTI